MALPSTDELQADVASARAQLDSAIAELRAGVTPQALAERGAGAVRGWFTDGQGAVRPDRIAIVAGVVVGIVAIRALTRRRGR